MHSRVVTFNFYKDCLLHSLDAKNALPKFYIGIRDNEIICSYALLTNDIVSRQDLMPWFACLFVNEDQRNQKYAERLLNHALEETRKKGFEQLYLSSDLVNFYERKGWKLFCTAYNVFGEAFPVYAKSC